MQQNLQEKKTFLKCKHHHLFHRDAGIFFGLFLALLRALQSMRQGGSYLCAPHIYAGVLDANPCWCGSEAPTVRCCCSSEVCCCYVVLVRTLQHCSVPSVKQLYAELEPAWQNRPQEAACSLQYLDSDSRPLPASPPTPLQSSRSMANQHRGNARIFVESL